MSGSSEVYSVADMEARKIARELSLEVQKRVLSGTAPQKDPRIVAIRERTDISELEKDKLCAIEVQSWKAEVAPLQAVPTFRKLNSSYNDIKTPAQLKAEDDARILAARALVPVQVIKGKSEKKSSAPKKTKGVIDLSSGVLIVSDKPKKEKKDKVVDLSGGTAAKTFTFLMFNADGSYVTLAVEKANESFPKIKDGLLSGGYVRAKLSHGVCLTLIRKDDTGQTFAHTRKWFADMEKARLSGVKCVAQGIGKSKVDCRNCQGLGRIAKYTANGYPICGVCEGEGKVDGGERIAICSFTVNDTITRVEVAGLERPLSRDPKIPSWKSGAIMHVNKTNGTWKPKCGTTRVTFSKG